MLVPYKPDFGGLQKAHVDFHMKDFRQKRQKVLSELRCLSGLPEVARILNPETLYKVVAPEGKLLQQGKDGLFRGVYYGDQGIDQHAKFAEIGPGLMEAAKTVGSQVLLVSIAMQLNRIEQMVENLSIEMHRDRIAEIYSGVEQFERAMEFVDSALRDQCIINATQTLHTGLQKTIEELRSRIAEAPSPENRISDHLAPWYDKIGRANKIMGLACESFQATLHGVETLAECYSVLGQVEAARNALLDYFEKVSNCNVKSAAEKARLVECSGSILPQEPWETFDKVLPTIRRHLLDLPLPRSMTAARDPVVEIEFMPNELYGGINGNLP